MGTPFAITVRAEDAFGNLAIHHNDVLTLTDSTHTLRPITATFNAGLWGGAVTIAQVQSDVVITATTGSVSATSTPFDVVAVKLYLPLVLKSN